MPMMSFLDNERRLDPATVVDIYNMYAEIPILRVARDTFVNMVTKPQCPNYFGGQSLWRLNYFGAQRALPTKLVWSPTLSH